MRRNVLLAVIVAFFASLALAEVTRALDGEGIFGYLAVRSRPVSSLWAVAAGGFGLVLVLLVLAAGRLAALLKEKETAETERRSLRQQLIQSQKMEAVGRLAGGIAHDFNNILQVIIGFSELILALGTEGPEVAKHVGTIRDSAARAASLTQHLLAFSRRQMLTPKVIDTDAFIEETLVMLSRLLGENIQVTHRPDSEPPHVRIDPGQFGQVITNLAVNARDAMPFGGRLEINVSHFEKAGDWAGQPQMLPGEYVLIQVSDNGTGMDEETLSHLFEPFFTTKVLGRGTGLGLSIVYGIIKQSGGYISVDSALGRGTTFSMYIPRMRGTGDEARSCPEEEHNGTETILLVEDQEDVRRLVHSQLSNCGYRVLEAGSAAAALEICRQNAGRFQLLLTDVILPDARGERVAQEFRAMNPLAQIVFMTGYPGASGFIDASQRERASILHKPFTLSELASRIRQSLDSQ